MWLNPLTLGLCLVPILLQTSDTMLVRCPLSGQMILMFVALYLCLQMLVFMALLAFTTLTPRIGLVGTSRPGLNLYLFTIVLVRVQCIDLCGTRTTGIPANDRTRLQKQRDAP